MIEFLLWFAFFTLVSVAMVVMAVTLNFILSIKDDPIEHLDE